MPTWLGILSGWLYLVWITVLILMVLMRRRSAQAAMGWSLAILFIPVFGGLFFLLFGRQRIAKRLRRKIAHRDAYEATLARSQDSDPNLAPAVGDAYPARISRLMDRIGEGPRRGGNTVAFFDAGGDAYRAIAEAVRAAKHHVHVEVYIFRNDEIGKRFATLLEEKLAEGVEVRLIVDAVGTFAARRLLRRVRKAGGEGFSFLPLGFLGKRVSFNLRNHRKIVVCDGKVGFIGGLNVGEEYLGKEGPKGEDWYDLHLQVEGPSVLDIQHVFAEDWHFGTGEMLDATAYFPHPVERSGTTLQMIRGGPDVDAHPIRQSILSAVMAARERIWIATPYLVPDRPLMDALRIAAYGGCAVRIITPRPPADNRLAAAAGVWHAEELIEAGVEVLHYEGGMMHAKAILVDDDWALVGSANLDNRSLHLNFELMAIFDDPVDLDRIRGHLAGLLERGDRLTLEAIRSYSWPKRFLIATARLLSPVL